MDTFARNHLAAWVSEHVWDDDVAGFTSWVEDEIADDPGLIDLGWSRLYGSYQRLYR